MTKNPITIPITATSKAVMGGQLRVFGTRVLYSTIVNAMSGPRGMTDHDIAEAWPTVTPEQITRIRAKEGL